MELTVRSLLASRREIGQLCPSAIRVATNGSLQQLLKLTQTSVALEDTSPIHKDISRKRGYLPEGCGVPRDVESAREAEGLVPNGALQVRKRLLKGFDTGHCRYSVLVHGKDLKPLTAVLLHESD